MIVVGCPVASMFMRVAVERPPVRCRPGRLELVELAEVTDGLADRLGPAPDGAGALVAQRVVLGVVAAQVLTGGRLGVLRVVRLHQPVVPLSRVRTGVVDVVVQAELRRRARAGSASRSRRTGSASGRRCRSRHVAELLVVGAVLLDDQEHVLDRRGVPEAHRYRYRRRLRCCRCSPSPIRGPAVVLEDLGGVAGDVVVAGQLEPGHAARGVVGVVAPLASGRRASIPRVLPTTIWPPTTLTEAGK